MKKIFLRCLAALGLALFVGGTALAQQTTYTLNSSGYESVAGLFTTSMRPTGFFTTNRPLQPNQTDLRIGPLDPDPYVTAWHFDDGNAATYTEANSYVFPTGFRVDTDAAGNIVSAFVALQSPLPPNNVGDELTAVLVSETNFVSRRGGECLGLTDGVCSGIVFSSGHAFGSASISWSSRAITSQPVSIPTLSEWGLIGMAVLMALVTWVTLRRQA